MSLVYENKIIGAGDMVSAFQGEKMFILFGDNAPDTLKDFCYTIDIKDTNKEISVGQILDIDGSKFEITAVGNVAEKNLTSLGHMTVAFDGAKEASLPGSIYVENADMPELKIGTIIKIEG